MPLYHNQIAKDQNRLRSSADTNQKNLFARRQLPLAFGLLTGLAHTRDREVYRCPFRVSKGLEGNFLKSFDSSETP